MLSWLLIKDVSAASKKRLARHAAKFLKSIEFEEHQHNRVCISSLVIDDASAMEESIFSISLSSSVKSLCAYMAGWLESKGDELNSLMTTRRVLYQKKKKKQACEPSWLRFEEAQKKFGDPILYSRLWRLSNVRKEGHLKDAIRVLGLSLYSPDCRKIPWWLTQYIFFDSSRHDGVHSWRNRAQVPKADKCNHEESSVILYILPRWSSILRW